MTDLKITEATVQLVVNEQEPVFLQVLRGPIVVAGGGGVTVHNDLTGRSDPDAHPISSITGLSAALAAAGNVDSVNGQTGTVVLDLDDLTDVDTTTDPPDADDVLAWDGVMWTPATLQALGAPDLSNATPADLGTAAPGVSTEASRADHVHDLPTAADVGAAASLHVHSGADITSGTVATARLGSGTANATTFLRGDQTWAAAGGSETLPASLIDAKGDLIVGTANDTAARLGVGSNGQVLTADSAQTAGVKWAAAGGVQDSVPYVSGNYYQLGPPPLSSTTAGSNSAGRLGAHPIYLPAGSYQSVGVWIDSPAVSTWRFGVYPNDPTTMTPCGQALLKDMGTISTNSTGLVSASSTFTIPTSGVYWLAVLCDAYTASPSVRGLATGSAAGILPFRGVTAEGFTSNPPYVSPFLWSVGVTTGAMPATFPATFGTNVYRAQNYIPYLIARAS